MRTLDSKYDCEYDDSELTEALEFLEPVDIDNNTNKEIQDNETNNIENTNPYIEMLTRIKEKNINLINQVKDEINITVDKKKAIGDTSPCITGLVSIFSIPLTLFLGPLCLGIIPISITSCVALHKKFKNKEAFLNYKCNLLNSYYEVINTKINIFKKINSLKLNKNYDISKIIDGELQHNYNLDKIYNLKINDFADYKKINELLDKAIIENTVYLDFFKANDIENKKQLSDNFISKEKQNLLENNEQKQITTLELPPEPIGFKIEPTYDEEIKTYEKTKKFPN